MLRFLFLLAICLYLLSNLVSQPILDMFLSAVSFLIVLFSVIFVSKIVLTFGLVFLFTGTMMLINSSVEWTHYLFAFGEMLNLITLFALIPILALPIKLGKYEYEVEAVIQKKIKSTGQLYMVSSSMSYFLSSFMNLAALPMTYYSISPSVRIFTIKNKERFLSRSITHGFAMPLLWTPVTPIVGTVIEMTGVSYSSILPILIPLSIVGLLLDWAIAHIYAKKSKAIRMEGAASEEIKRSNQEVSASKEGKSIFRLFHILAAIVLLNIVILTTEQFMDLSFLFLISLLVIPFSFTWTLFLRKEREYITGLKNHFKTQIIKMKDQFFLFLSAGFFISAMNISGTNQTINDCLSSIIEMIGIEMVLVVLPFVPVTLAFIGLHPAIAFVLIVEAINAGDLGLSPIVMTIALLGGSVPAFLMGPYNATLGIMSNIVKKTPFKISNWNFPFCFAYLAGVVIFLQVAHFVL